MVSPELQKSVAELAEILEQVDRLVLTLNTEIAGGISNTLDQTQTTVADIANQYNITLIIRFDSKPIDPENRADVIKGVNRNIVYQKNLDLTNMVIDKMGSVSTANAGGNLNNQ